MPTFIRSHSFSTQNTFNSEKDDREVNQSLLDLISKGASVQEVRMELAASGGSTNVQYLILYEAPAPL